MTIMVPTMTIMTMTMKITMTIITIRKVLSSSRFRRLPKNSHSLIPLYAEIFLNIDWGDKRYNTARWSLSIAGFRTMVGERGGRGEGGRGRGGGRKKMEREEGRREGGREG